MIHGTRNSITAGCPCNLCTLVGAQLRDPRPAPTSVPTSDCTYCTRAAETGRRLTDYIIRTEKQ